MDTLAPTPATSSPDHQHDTSPSPLPPEPDTARQAAAGEEPASVVDSSSPGPQPWRETNPLAESERAPCKRVPVLTADAERAGEATALSGMVDGSLAPNGMDVAEIETERAEA